MPAAPETGHGPEAIFAGPPGPDWRGDGFGRGGPACAGQSDQSWHILQRLLFLVEHTSPEWREQKRRLSLFLTRQGGFHLMLALLDAYYAHERCGAKPGVVFSELCSRIAISERGLRLLISDAVAASLIEQIPVGPGDDRRCRSYRVTQSVVRAWETLLGAIDEKEPPCPAVPYGPLAERSRIDLPAARRRVLVGADGSHA